MDNLTKLLEYQSVDMQVGEIEKQLRDSSLRKKLVHARNYLLGSQNQLQQMEVEAGQVQGQLALYQNRVEDASAQYQALLGRLGEPNEQSALSELEKARREVQDLGAAIAKYEREVQTLMNKLLKMNQELKKMAANVPTAKANYTQLKDQYDAELAQTQEKAKPFRQQMEQIAQGVSPDLLTRYDNIKKKCANPLVKLMDARCTGCNMELPSSVVKKIHDEGKISECENCGRMLYVE